MIIETKRTEGKCPAAAHAPSVDDTADSEPHDPDSEPENDTTEPNHQGFNQHGESSNDAETNPSFDEGPNDDPEDELGPWVNYIVRATHKPHDLLTVDGITSWILRRRRMYWILNGSNRHCIERMVWHGR